MMMPAVFGVKAASMAAMSIWKSGSCAGTSIVVQPAVSAHTAYSGKYGAITMISSPGLVIA